MSKSGFIKYFNLNFPQYNKKHTDLTLKIINESKKAYESKFNGTFYVLIHPLSINSKKSNYMVKLLKENNIKVLSYPIKYTDEYRINGDIHPNAKLNRLLAIRIANDVR